MGPKSVWNRREPTNNPSVTPGQQYVNLGDGLVSDCGLNLTLSGWFNITTDTTEAPLLEFAKDTSDLSTLRRTRRRMRRQCSPSYSRRCGFSRGQNTSLFVDIGDLDSYRRRSFGNSRFGIRWKAGRPLPERCQAINRNHEHGSPFQWLGHDNAEMRSAGHQAIQCPGSTVRSTRFWWHAGRTRMTRLSRSRIFRPIDMGALPAGDAV